MPDEGKQEQAIQDGGKIVDTATGGLLHDTVDRIVEHERQDLHDLHELDRDLDRQDHAEHEDHEAPEHEAPEHDASDHEGHGGED